MKVAWTTTATLVGSTIIALLVSPSFGSSHHGDNHVTCGSAIKLTHIESGSKFYLNSAPQNLGSGSGQQIVTLLPDNKSVTSSLWLVREAHGASSQCAPGQHIVCGGIIRLTHLDTMKNLHSHAVASPLSRQNEVTGFGMDGEGDDGDDWKVVCAATKGEKEWKRGDNFHLQHVATNVYLSASSKVKFNEQNCGARCPIMNHLEVFGRKSPDQMSLFKVELGIHLSH